MRLRRAALFVIYLTLILRCFPEGDQKEKISYIVEQVKGRKVYLVIPKGDCPEKGYPVVILLHGMRQTAGAWFGQGLLGRGDQKLFPQLILESGMIVMAPEALEPFGKGTRQWDFIHQSQPNSRDLVFFNDLFQWMQGNSNIKFDLSNIYAVGISSGGFMASRLALAFPDKWAALVIIAAGYADSFPGVPSFPIDNKPLSHELSSKHPPTLVIHGDKDRIVPFSYGEIYYQDLKKAGVKTELLVIPGGGHRWPSIFHEKIIEWLSSRKKNVIPGEENMDKFSLDDTFEGKTIPLETRETFSLSLKGVPTAGYVWKIVEIDETMLKKLEEGEKALTKPGLVGGSTQFFWRFQCVAKGKTCLILKQYRPWEGPEKAIKTFHVVLEIQ